MGKTTRRPGPTGGVKRLAVAIDTLDTRTAKVGFFESAKYPDGTPVALVAAVQEYGSGAIPPRSFMRTTIAEQSQAWTTAMGRGAAAIAKGRYTVEQVLDGVGQLAAADVRAKIASIKSPPLDPDTVAARRRRYADKKTTGNLTKPLVDTAVMVNSVTSIVEEK